jgi:hypothetical protein
MQSEFTGACEELLKMPPLLQVSHYVVGLKQILRRPRFPFRLRRLGVPASRCDAAQSMTGSLLSPACSGSLVDRVIHGSGEHI